MKYCKDNGGNYYIIDSIEKLPNSGLTETERVTLKYFTSNGELLETTIVKPSGLLIPGGMVAVTREEFLEHLTNKEKVIFKYKDSIAGHYYRIAKNIDILVRGITANNDGNQLILGGSAVVWNDSGIHIVENTTQTVNLKKNLSLPQEVYEITRDQFVDDIKKRILGFLTTNGI